MSLIRDAEGMATVDTEFAIPASLTDLCDGQWEPEDEGLSDYRRDEEAFGFEYELSLL